jgi:uncharacterized protein
MSVARSGEAQKAPYHIMTKPIGPICNLDCKYCFYLEKEKLYPDKSNWRMSEGILERYVQQYIESQDIPEISFAWQGGEPTLMGVDFFRRLVALQQKHANGKRINNAVQTNGTLLDDEWCAFFREHGFLIGLSIDGPRECHDQYRVDKQGRPTFDQVMRGMGFLKKHQVDFNALCVVNRYNSTRPLEVYEFLRTEGSGFMQFIPLIERTASPETGMDLAAPPVLELKDGTISLPLLTGHCVTPWSVEPLAYGDFLGQIFDVWVRRDVGSAFVQIFDIMLGIWMGMPAALCVFGQTCGSAMALEHNGDLYACDHFVYPRYKLGNIAETAIRELVDSPLQRKFGQDKRDTLPRYCRECEVRFACQGECPKHRFLTTPEGESGLNYLCAGYKKFLKHIDPAMTTMAQLLKQGYPAAEIMNIMPRQDTRPQPPASWSAAGRNDPCPCGSGRKYKKCCSGKR